MKLNNKNIYLIGIGGICISGIAKILINKNNKISGSDLFENNNTKYLKKIGANIFYKHSHKNINDKIDFVSYSSAINKNNVEILESKKLNIPIIKRGILINEIVKNYKFSISVSGSHGKTTTASILTYILLKNNMSPGFIIGGKIKNIEYSSNVGNNNYFIIESDESDKSFLDIYSNVAIVTNIDNDHIRTYKYSMDNLIKSFLKFINNSKDFVLLCYDNENIKKIIPFIKKKIYTYGFNKNSDFVIKKYYQNNNFNYFNMYNLNLKLNINIILKNSLGKHNSLNALAAIIVSIIIKIPYKIILKSLNSFPGVEKRLNILGNFNLINKKNNINKKNIKLIIDYGHHPTEINETFKTIKKYMFNNKIIMLFQPHRFTRTYDLLEEFIKVLVKVDYLIILDIYSANEKYIGEINGISFFNKIKKIKNKNIIFCKNKNYILNNLIKILKSNDIVIFQGAGDISDIAKEIINNKKFKKIF